MFLSEELYYDYVPDEISLTMNELIKKELNTRLKSDYEELYKLRELNKSYELKIYELQKEIKEVKQNYDNKLKSVLLEKEKEVKRKIFQGFTIGDEVYFIEHKYKYTPCLTCKETGKLKIQLNGKEEKVGCPLCDGRGSNDEYENIIRQGKISEINFKTWHDESEKCTHLKFYIQTDEGNLEVDIDDIFLTEDEAIKECRLRNKKEIE